MLLAYLSCCVFRRITSACISRPSRHRACFSDNFFCLVWLMATKCSSRVVSINVTSSSHIVVSTLSSSTVFLRVSDFASFLAASFPLRWPFSRLKGSSFFLGHLGISALDRFLEKRSTACSVKDQSWGLGCCLSRSILHVGGLSLESKTGQQLCTRRSS